MHGRGDPDPTYATDMQWAQNMRAELAEVRAERDALLDHLANLIAEREGLLGRPPSAVKKVTLYYPISREQAIDLKLLKRGETNED